MTPMMSTDEFKNKVHSCNPNLEVLSEYKGIRSKVLRRCKVCGDTREVTARTLLSGRKCISCVAAERAKGLRKTHSQFVDELRQINCDIEILTEYTTNDNPVLCRCSIDKTEWQALPHTLLQGHGCPECGRQRNVIASRHRMSHDEFVANVAARFCNVKVLSKYKSAAQKVNYACADCGYEWTADPYSILQPHAKGCPKCAGRIVVDLDTFLDRLKTANEFVRYVSGYSSISRHATFECVKCGHQWSAYPHNVLRGRCCPKCNLSNGAKRIAAYLQKHQYTFIQEQRFDECRDQRPLPFDFFLPDHNIAIEYDGEQHFEPVRFGECSVDKATEKFKLAHKHDNIKDEFCKNNGITLIRIPYTDFDKIEDILDKHIS